MAAIEFASKSAAMIECDRLNSLQGPDADMYYDVKIIRQNPYRYWGLLRMVKKDGEWLSNGWRES